MTAVRGINEASRRMHTDFRRGVVVLKIIGQCSNGVYGLKTARRGVISKCGDRVGKFVDHIGILSVRMKCEVTGPGARRNRGIGRVVGFKAAFFIVVAIDHNPVNAQVNDEGEVTGGIQLHRMRVRRLLTGMYA